MLLRAKQKTNETKSFFRSNLQDRHTKESKSSTLHTRTSGFFFINKSKIVTLVLNTHQLHTWHTHYIQYDISCIIVSFSLIYQCYLMEECLVFNEEWTRVYCKSVWTFVNRLTYWEIKSILSFIIIFLFFIGAKSTKFQLYLLVQVF